MPIWQMRGQSPVSTSRKRFNTVRSTGKSGPKVHWHSPPPEGRKRLRKGTTYGCPCNHYILRISLFFCPSRLSISKCPVSVSRALDTATSRRLGLPLLLWRRGLGRGGRHISSQPLSLSATVFVPLSPTLSPRSAGGEREKSPVAVSSNSSAVRAWKMRPGEAAKAPAIAAAIRRPGFRKARQKAARAIPGVWGEHPIYQPCRIW